MVWNECCDKSVFIWYGGKNVEIIFFGNIVKPYIGLFDEKFWGFHALRLRNVSIVMPVWLCRWPQNAIYLQKSLNILIEYKTSYKCVATSLPLTEAAAILVVILWPHNSNFAAADSLGCDTVFLSLHCRCISWGTSCCLPDIAAVGRGRPTTSDLCAQRQFTGERQDRHMYVTVSQSD